ncbi:TetR/AcrR family transcriptional regulator [Nocardioides sp. cx-173]|uniref:TetR/AcrR family transcriptional regulator n=1 Tax=Nocardioides sp. cx-173 TaxID=2898796 RepID=UPI001E5269EE|nr:TetR/AcrR family transcriptional regulator [Nocardioides sp. cx-173]MCD4524129.1 TetR/AcrR family transcriptional regulator [Nocardioides sp. cx-173]UGB41525.1 TetR/AcrR family transcriptional regulator [Nocardioides sp. cx-173]
MSPSDAERPRRRAGNGAGSSRRAELLGIAERLFATRGYSQTTVRDIADEAGILSGSLYHHFDSKEAMLQEILQDFMQTLLAGFEESVERGGGPRESLDGLIRSAFATIHASPDAVALYQNESAVIATLPELGFVGETSARVNRIWLGVIEEGQRSGDFREDLEPLLVYRFVRDAVWATVRWYRPDGRLRHESVADQYLALLHGGLLRP